MEIKIAKFEPYPDVDAVGVAVGYDIKTNNNRIFYKDVVVPLADTVSKTDEEIIELAWESVKEEIIQKVEDLESRPALIGSMWNPPVIEEVVEGGEI